MTRLLRSTFAALILLLIAGAGAAHAAVSGLDQQYLSSAIQGDRFEVQGGQLALAKSQNPAVRTLAARLVKDHKKSLADASALAHHLGIDVPKTPSPSQRWELEIVGSLSGQAFDQWYSRLEVADHHQDISEAAEEVKLGVNKQVRSSAHDEIPSLRAHLKLAQATLKAS